MACFPHKNPTGLQMLPDPCNQGTWPLKCKWATAFGHVLTGQQSMEVERVE